MKISQAEIDAALADFRYHSITMGGEKFGMQKALEAAYRVRKARKRAERDAKLPTADDVRGILSRAEGRDAARNAAPITQQDIDWAKAELAKAESAAFTGVTG